MNASARVCARVRVHACMRARLTHSPPHYMHTDQNTFAQPHSVLGYAHAHPHDYLSVFMSVRQAQFRHRPSPTACQLRAYGRAGTQNDHLGESLLDTCRLQGGAGAAETAGSPEVLLASTDTGHYPYTSPEMVSRHMSIHMSARMSNVLA